MQASARAAARHIRVAVADLDLDRAQSGARAGTRHTMAVIAPEESAVGAAEEMLAGGIEEAPRLPVERGARMGAAIVERDQPPGHAMHEHLEAGGAVAELEDFRLALGQILAAAEPGSRWRCARNVKKRYRPRRCHGWGSQEPTAPRQGVTVTVSKSPA